MENQYYMMEELETQGLVRESGLAESAGGRRAMYYEAQKNSRLAIGADITRNHLRLALLNLAGEVQDTRRIRLAFANDEAYRQRLRQELEAFLNVHFRYFQRSLQLHLLQNTSCCIPYQMEYLSTLKYCLFVVLQNYH